MIRNIFLCLIFSCSSVFCVPPAVPEEAQEAEELSFVYLSPDVLAEKSKSITTFFSSYAPDEASKKYNNFTEMNFRIFAAQNSDEKQVLGVFGAFVNDEMIGLVRTFSWVNGQLMKLKGGYEMNIGIHPDKRGQGYATLLLEKAFSHFETQGLDKKLWMTVNVENLACLSLMSKFIASQHVNLYDLRVYGEDTFITFVRKREDSSLEFPLTEEQKGHVFSYINEKKEGAKEDVEILAAERTTATNEENMSLLKAYRKEMEELNKRRSKALGELGCGW